MAELVVPPVVFDTPTVNTDAVVPVKEPPIVTPDADPALPAANPQTQFNQVSGGFTSITNENGIPEFTVTAQRPIQEAPDAVNTPSKVEKTRAEGQINPYLAKGDWRVRLSLATNANYLYKIANQDNILYPLKDTDGVVFPYTPSISTVYQAGYAAQDVAHSNYKIFQYQNSSIEQITIQTDFTCQDTYEANYLLAVIHFFRCVTKMFYGQDNNPNAGVPPPLCFLHGLGSFQYDNHPLVVSSFTYNLPEDVDYIRAGTGVPGSPGVSLAPQQGKDGSGSLPSSGSEQRLAQNQSQFKVMPGGVLAPPQFARPNVVPVQEPTYVPTRIKVAITAYPVVSREDISNTFSLEKYATGELLRGSKRSGGGIW